MNHSIRNFDDAAETILKFLSTIVPVNTLFIAKNDECTNEIEKVVNKKGVLLDEGDKLPFNDTYCKLSVNHGNRVLLIPDLQHSELTKSMDVTLSLGNGSFIGIPIYYGDGTNYGTICGLDNEPFEFHEEHIEIFTTMASLLSYVLDLDRVNKEVEELSVPIVSLTDGVAVLPIIGDITEKRANLIIDSTLKQSTSLSLRYLIVDLSGIIRINERIIHYLLSMMKMLKLVGVTPILTGIHPEHAVKMVDNRLLVGDILIKNSLESALAHIGFSLVENNPK
ncbi:STAS domain-containing protein [Mesobacillus selenatarsenatis]|uniref:STAS domain-containing protein n=1 Tax=Mesobacillus selenatarsenatis (strain DSM 18680 / JCM 14380 / FERM P-15431 / SF-1) TaxID=1321606 RepID=A0A0A8XB90_MESS1|nr:STAS domain-containing protein [Mesobacillus selenatarsenatis]GAM16292.1 hypothetical protein SAMD00020551_4480 [Mesobacillus selenatarsenatis SF-1]